MEPPQEIRVESAFVENGLVSYRTRKDLRLFQQFNLRKYPFDRHTIPVVFSDLAYSSKEMTLQLAGPAAITNETETQKLNSPQFVMDWISMFAGTAKSSVSDEDGAYESNRIVRPSVSAR